MSAALDALDDAIHEYLQATDRLEPGRGLSGWVLAFETNALGGPDPENPQLVFRPDYTIGPQTSLGQSLGVTTATAGAIKSTMVECINGDDDD